MDSHLASSSHRHPSFPPGSFANQHAFYGQQQRQQPQPQQQQQHLNQYQQHPTTGINATLHVSSALQSTPAASSGNFQETSGQTQQGNGLPVGLYPTTSGGNATMASNTNMLAQQQQQQQQQQYMQRQQNLYPNAAFAQPPSTPSSTAGPPQQLNSGASAPNHIQPFATPQHNISRQAHQGMNGSQAPPQHMNPLQTSQPPAQPQMAMSPRSAGPTARSGGNNNNINNGNTGMQTPMSPGTLAKEQEKVASLLGLNTLLLQEIITLQSNGKGGPIGQVTPQKDDDTGGKTEIPAKEFMDCMRCLQSNLAYLAQLSPQKLAASATLRGPAIMEPPATVPQAVKDAYEKLKPLFPGWNGTKPGTQGNAGPGPQNRPGVTTSTSAPAQNLAVAAS